jgi:serine/threonine protein kinase
MRPLNGSLQEKINLRQNITSVFFNYANLKSDRFLKPISFNQTKDNFYLVFPDPDCKNLKQILEASKKKSCFGLGSTIILVEQLIETFRFASSKNISHREIDPEAVFILDSGLVLDGFSAALHYTVEGGQCKNYWNAGVLTYHLLYSKPPFNKPASSDLRKSVGTKLQLSEYPGLPPEVFEFLRGTIETDPAKVWNHSKVKEFHSYLSQQDKDKLGLHSTIIDRLEISPMKKDQSNQRSVYESKLIQAKSQVATKNLGWNYAETQDGTTSFQTHASKQECSQPIVNNASQSNNPLL